LTYAFISSASGSLEDYRAAAMDACSRHEITPIAMERFTADDQPPIEVCQAKVRSAHVLILLLADRYGVRPDGHDRSYTELEYDWAMQHGIPVLTYVATDGFSWSGPPRDAAALSQYTEDMAALQRFIARVKKAHTVKRFAGLDNFRMDLYEALMPYRPAKPTAERAKVKAAKVRGPWFRKVRTLPSPPHLCAMPPYVSGTPFTGRRTDLRDLDAWTRSEDPVLVVEAIGGTGKSALTWAWTTTRAKSVMKPAGIFWWSFYDGSPSMERFLRELLSYLTSGKEQSRISRDELPLLVDAELRRGAYLIVLDGFERLLMAYHQFDPSKVTEDDVEADRRANKHSMIDALGYEFVRGLVHVSPSKVLISTRMVPDALEGPSGGLLPRVERWRLPGLLAADVRELLGRLEITAGPEALSFLHELGNHPLLIAIVAGLARNYRPAPGNLSAWLAGQAFRVDDPKLASRRHHILDAAMRDLEPGTARLLSWISALSGTVHWDVLESINPLAADGLSKARAGALLDAALGDLEVRGLLWWNRQMNTYDMHPIVRAFAYDRLESADKFSAHARIRDHFQALPPEDAGEVSSVEDRTQTITLFRALTGAEQYGEAYALWNRSLMEPLLLQLGANTSVVELLEPFRHTNVIGARADHSLALHMAGKHDKAIQMELKNLDLVLRDADTGEVRRSLGRLAAFYRAAGQLARHAAVVAVLETGKTDLAYASRPTLVLRRAILELINGDVAKARATLQDMAGSAQSDANPWFYNDLRYWRMVADHRSGQTLSPAFFDEVEKGNVDWRSRLAFATLKFRIALEAGDLRLAATTAERIDRLRRVGGQEAMPIESAITLVKLGRAEATETVAECFTRLSRLHPFDRPHYLCAMALTEIGRLDEAVEQAQQARLQAWADGPQFSYRYELRQAEALLTRLGASLDPLAPTGRDERTVPLLSTARKKLELG
jgi:tetratricopeptide (TPR) repeat protein